MKKKETIAILVSLLFVLSLLSGLPACAATSYIIPKTVAITIPETGDKGTITFSVNGNTLTETAAMPDEEFSGFTEYSELAFLPGNTDVNQQLLSIDRAMTDYPALPNPMIFSPLLTSGKISQIVVNYTTTYTNEKGKKLSRTRKSTIPVKAENGRVVRFGDEQYIYDARGNLAQQIVANDNGGDLGTIWYNYDENGRLESIQAEGDFEPGDPSTVFQWSGNSIRDEEIEETFTVTNGKIVNGKGMDGFSATYNTDGTLKTYSYYFAKHSITYQTIYL